MWSCFRARPNRWRRIVRLCNRAWRVRSLPRGAGTSLAGGCLPVGGGVMIVLTRMKEILEINLRDRYAVVQPGVVNVWLTNALKGTGYHYAPDPSSQGACTIGGNVATNSGGPHTLKYGVTVNHVLGVEAVLADGAIVQFGGPAEDPAGLGSGRRDRRQRRHAGHRHQSLGAADAQSPRRAHDARRLRFGRRCHQRHQRDHRRGHRSGSAGNDGPRASWWRSKQAFHFGFPLDAGAMLLIEVDGLEAGLDAQRDRNRRTLPRSAMLAKCARRTMPQERLKLWKMPQASLWCNRPAEPQLLHARRRGAAHETAAYPASDHRNRRKACTCEIVNVFHAGDGNIHPILLFDERDAGQSRSVCWLPAPRFSTSASPAAAASRASMALAWRRSASCASCSPTTTLGNGTSPRCVQSRID